MIKQIVDNHNGKVFDKWESYLDNYETILYPYQDKPIDLLEIGVANGGSLDVWSKYFTKAKHIVGCDINPKCESLKYSDDRVTVIVGDANKPETLEEIGKISETFDIIIDDGSHINSDVVKTFAYYYPLLKYNGLYIVEDLHTSYWRNWGGGLRMHFSSMSFFKRLIDIINYEHWRIRRTRMNYLKYFEQAYEIKFGEDDLSTIYSVMFVNSMVIIKKNSLNKCMLGGRIVRGEDEHIMPNYLEMDGINISRLIVEAEDDWQYDPIAMIQRINQLGEQHDNPV